MVLDAPDFICGHYFRVQVADQIGVMAEITRALADQQIGIEAILQKDPPSAEDDARVMIVTKPARESRLTQVLDHLRALPYTRKGIVHMRVAQFED
jgi:homoserine dehydrogenase